MQCISRGTRLVIKAQKVKTTASCLCQPFGLRTSLCCNITHAYEKFPYNSPTFRTRFVSLALPRSVVPHNTILFALLYTLEHIPDRTASGQTLEVDFLTLKK